ncbi:MAG: Na/Pi cotransporter family protein [Clostridia bacterium]|nr:Na/Pi cotransporter family protein [Clostridia bacterium]
MDIFNAILILLAGCGVFIAGMNMLSDGLEHSAGGGMKKLLGKISNNRFAGVGIGAAVTGIIQSSSATSVMVIGLVNAGVMTLTQATAIIMGANIGTTVTGILVSLKSLNISLYMTLLAFIGVMMTFFKKERIKQIGGILCGLGLIFVGLDLMSSAFGGSGLEQFFQEKVFSNIKFPLLLIFCGMAFTALIQSSSAATGLFIVMVGAGALELESALFLVLGSNIGTCITAVLAALGTGVNAKRAALIHLTFNVIGTILFTIFLWIFTDPIIKLFDKILPGNPQMQLAWFHVIFNVTTTIILLPFVKQLVQFASIVIQEKKAEETPARHLKYVDERLLKAPSIAVMQVKKEIECMADTVRNNLEKSFEALRLQSDKYGAELYENEEMIDFTNNAVNKYLIRLSALVDTKDEKKIGAYFHVLNDLERIGDHAENFYEIGTQMKKQDLVFSETAISEIQEMQNKVLRMFEIAEEAFDNMKTDRLSELTALENEVDGMKRSLSANHVARLSEGTCKVELSAYFFSTVSGLERVADHLVNVGYSILNPTGSQSIAKQEGSL